MLLRTLIVLLAALACTKQEKAPEMPSLDLQLEHRNTVGGDVDVTRPTNTPSKSLEFEFPSFVRVDESGAIYVLDTGSRIVLVFDSLGNQRATLGRSGSGPGELKLVTALDVASDGTVWVLDVGNAKAVAFRHDTVHAEVHLDFQPAGIAALDSAEVWVAGDLRSSIFVRLSADGRKLGSVGVPADTSFVAFRSNQGVAANGMGACAVAWVYAYRSVVQCFARDGSLRWRTGGPVRVDWPKDADPFGMSERDIFAYKDVSVVGDHVYALFKGDVGAPKARDVHVFRASDGHFVGREQLPDSVSNFGRSRSLLASVSYDGEYDVPRLHVYGVITEN